uniref:Endo-1,5-alpha-L-arabinanase A n=1 Tax=Plectus sambesii TaxID=2011161 RepID=A0A914XCI7_9BILA
MTHSLLLLLVLVTVAKAAEYSSTLRNGSASPLLSSTCGNCNYGHCVATKCICDEGFQGAECNEQGADFYHRTELIHGMADPDMIAVNDDLFFLSGTWDGNVLPIYQSTDMKEFQLKTTYNPTSSDFFYTYCMVWAPDLSKRGSAYDLHFSAQRVTKGRSCPDPVQDVTTFVASAPDDNLMFGMPTLVDFGNNAPQGRILAGGDGEKVVRIDSTIINIGNDHWFFYVWFTKGNNIASISLASPTNVIVNTGPASFAISAIEENINEGPEVFEREGHYYLFFSAAFFNSQYAMYYIMAPSIADLTRKRAVRVHSVAQRNGAGQLIQSHGHNTIVARRGQFFNVFHQGNFDSAGHYIEPRSTFKQRIAFRPDGSIYTLNTVNLRWTQLNGNSYSVDVVTRDGSVIGPCISVGRIGEALGTIYNGVCPDSGDKLVDKGDIAEFRLYYSATGTWTDHVVQEYDGVSDDVAFYLPGGVTKQVALRWNELTTGTEYSLDVQHKDGSWVAPCVGDDNLGHQIEYLFNGLCSDAKTSVPPEDITMFRICSAMSGDWAHARCGAVPYDGKTINVAITIP